MPYVSAPPGGLLAQELSFGEMSHKEGFPGKPATLCWPCHPFLICQPHTKFKLWALVGIKIATKIQGDTNSAV